MMRVLVTAAARYGATAEIAAAIAEVLGRVSKVIATR
jgi:menaquinone-dependent protoporphyrinogen IX oxidase